MSARGVPGAGDPLQDGLTAWAGWSFADRQWWALAASDQQRYWFTNAHGVVAVADPDEWHDLPHAPGSYRTFLSTPPISLHGLEAVNETVVLPLHHPANARSMVLTFGLFNCGNNWWWAIDNIVVDNRVPPEPGEINTANHPVTPAPAQPGP